MALHDLTEKHLKQEYNDLLRCADNALSEAFDAINNAAYRDDSIATDKQIALIQLAMDQISHVNDNIIKAMD